MEQLEQDNLQKHASQIDQLKIELASKIMALDELADRAEVVTSKLAETLEIKKNVVTDNINLKTLLGEIRSEFNLRASRIIENEEEIEVCKVEILDLQKQFVRMKERLNSHTNNRIKEIREDIKRKVKMAIARYSDDLNHIVSDTGDVQNRIHVIEKEKALILEEFKSKKASLIKDLAVVESELHAKSKHIREQKSQISILQVSLKSDIEKLNHQISGQNTLKDDISRRLDSLEKEYGDWSLNKELYLQANTNRLHREKQHIKELNIRLEKAREIVKETHQLRDKKIAILHQSMSTKI